MSNSSWAPIALLLSLVAPCLGAVCVGLGRSRPGRWAGGVALTSALLLSLALALAWLARDGEAVLFGDGVNAGMLAPRLALRLDGLSLPFALNLALVAILSLWYALDYAVAQAQSFHALMLLFVASMLGALLADELILFALFWEGMLLTSSLLLLRHGDSPNAESVTLRYFIYTQAGSLALLGGLLWLAVRAESTSPQMVSLWAQQQGASLPWVIPAALAVGFLVKMAIVPLHGWLPDAHAIAPMPLTILLAAAMLAMGGYGMARFVFGMVGPGGVAALQTPLMVLAITSQILGALMGLASRDIKRIVAYSSISQMGYALLGIASFSSEGLSAGVMHIWSHGIVKSLLFMVIGLVIAATSRRQISRLGGLGKRLPRVMLALGIGALAISGLPPFITFASEWRILLADLASTHPALVVLAFVGIVLTSCYALALVGRLAWGSAPEDSEPLQPIPRSMALSTLATVILLILVSLAGYPLTIWLGGLITSAMGSGA